MRKIVFGVLAGGVLLGASACGSLDSVTGGGAKASACKNIESELKSFSSGGAAVTPGGGAASNAQKFADAASAIRSEGQKAGGDVETAATKFAQDLDDTAATLKRLSSGDMSGGTPDFTKMQQHGNELGKACGYSTFRIGG
ncbi:hypothetical protein [Spirillospora albida]|uniref:hypothetical protein n=1 Tax=Spirillospora albida TaxID=58123 RepID=UPI0004C0E1D6|nr:hypothetical protein [Spirillospora albida]